MKYSWEFKLECVNKYKNGEYITHPGSSEQRRHFMYQVRQRVKNYDDFGIDGLKHSLKNKNWTPEKIICKNLLLKILI